jgi:Na+-translocating ferredoxin:NAD+ oxidoreductase RnfD subunit
VTSIGAYAFNPSALGRVYISSTTTYSSDTFPSRAVFVLSDTTAGYATTQAQLATTQADLATTKAELAKIKADLAKTKTDLGTWFAQFPLTLKRILPKLIWSK